MKIEKIRQYLNAKINYLANLYRQEKDIPSRKELRARIKDLEETLSILDDEK